MMTHTTVFQSTPIAESPSTCSTCSYFSSFNGEERGLCHIFEKVFRRNNLRTSDCVREIESLQKQPKPCTVMVELITSEVSDDGYGYPVPIDSRTVEVNVAQSLKSLIEIEIASRDDLQGWQVATFWQPDGGFEI